jgi:hypothetical protein
VGVRPDPTRPVVTGRVPTAQHDLSAAQPLFLSGSSHRDRTATKITAIREEKRQRDEGRRGKKSNILTELAYKRERERERLEKRKEELKNK